MLPKVLAAAIAALFMLHAKPAEARHHHHQQHFHHHYVSYANNWARPARWCGWYMRKRHGGGPEYNLARNWVHFGAAARGPSIGVIVVWWHHVGEIVGRNHSGQWLVNSGNDGGTVRTRARSLAGAIAFRWPQHQYAMR